MKKNLMILGTESEVGKSTISIALCRLLKKKGYDIAPFKGITLSSESKKNSEGEDISIEQFVQAEACEIYPKGIINPIIIKENEKKNDKIMINGKFYRNKENCQHDDLKDDFEYFIKESLEKIMNNHNHIIIEGNGALIQEEYKYASIANEYIANLSDSEIILVANNENGGAIASLYGTLMLIDDELKSSIKGIIINKNKDNTNYLNKKIEELYEKFNIPVFGVIPYENIEIEKEKSVIKKIRSTKKSGLNIGIIKLENISNITDFYPLETEKNINIRYISSASELEGANLIIIPGSKSIIDDLETIRKNGIYEKIIELHNNGATVMGICGGFQMLGRNLISKENQKIIEGFDMLPFNTKFSLDKRTVISRGIVCSMENELKHLSNVKIYGYEIQNGSSEMLDDGEVFIIDKNNNIVGLSNDQGDVFGTYIHGIFEVEEFRKKLINGLKEKYNVVIENSTEEKEKYKIYRLEQYDKLAEIIEKNISLQDVIHLLEDDSKNTKEDEE